MNSNLYAVLIELVLQNNISGVITLIQTNEINLSVSDEQGRTALHFAACSGNSDMISTLLAAGADPNVLDKRGSSPLHLAATANRARVVALLLCAGTNPLQRDAMGKTALHWAKEHLARRLHSEQVSHTRVQQDLEEIIDELSAYMSATGQQEGVQQLNTVREKLSQAKTRSEMEDVEKMLGSLSLG